MRDDTTDATAANITDLARDARAAAAVLATADTATKNAALSAIADAITDRTAAILSANATDLAAANPAAADLAAAANPAAAASERGTSPTSQRHRANLTPALTDRLTLNAARIAAAADGCRAVARLPDPVGAVDDLAAQPSGIRVGKMRVPLGVVGIVYESRPNVTVDAAALCIKSGNAVVLRGGSEAIHSNLALAECLRAGLDDAGLPSACAQLVATTDRAAVGAMVTSEHLDLIIPRGGKSLIERVSREATVPVLRHLDGVCHVYVDDAADVAMATAVAFNAKTRRYGVCGAMETLLVAESIAGAVLPELAEKFIKHGVELRGCEKSRALVAQMKPADDADWTTEYLDAILSVRIVAGVDDAIQHINTHGSHHTDAIVTGDFARADKFLREVDSASVMVNASTQFADGYEYGLGAEVGISTDKLHARGPVGLVGLTCQKYIVIGDGHTRP